MNRPPRQHPTFLKFAICAMCAVILVAGSGCGVQTSEPVMDAAALLERYEKEQRRHDPINFSEVELGEYTVTQRHEPSIIYIRFHLYGVVPDHSLDEFGQLLQAHSERVRAQVREATQKCELDQLNDPSLGWLRSELIASLNRVMQSPVLRDVVFSEFSFERG